MVQNKVDYIIEASRLLADTYLKLVADPLPGYQLELKTLVYKALENRVLNKKERQFLLSEHTILFTTFRKYKSL